MSTVTEGKLDVRPTMEQLTRISIRRAGIVKGNILEVWRLRKPNKNGVQKARDLVKALRFKDGAEAQTALQLKIKEAQERRAGEPEPE